MLAYWAIPALLVVIWMYVRIQAYYRPASRDLKRLEAVARSPIYTHFGEAVAGLTTVRAFGCGERFQQIHDGNVNTNTRFYYYAFAVNRCVAACARARVGPLDDDSGGAGGSGCGWSWWARQWCCWPRPWSSSSRWASAARRRGRQAR